MYKRVVLLFSFLSAWAYGLDVAESSGRWSGKNIEQPVKMDSFQIRFVQPRTEEKKKFADFRYVFQKAVDLSDFTTISFEAKSTIPVKLQVALHSKDGGVILPKSQWSVAKTGTSWKKFEFRREDSAERKNFDSSKVSFIRIGVALWCYDTVKNDCELEIRNLRISTPADEFLIPKPTAQTVIDGVFRKDWGYENNLYFWTPPVMTTLSAPQNLVKGKAKAKKNFSGRFSFMYDENNLYFLGLVADSSPCSGTNPTEPWCNDSIELFLAPKLRISDLKSRKSLKKSGGIQIIFDCSNGGTPVVLRDSGVCDDSGIRYALKKTSVDADGKPVPGYVLEAAVPRALFQSWKPKRGEFIAYCINLNNEDGTSLRSSPSADQPHASVANYNRAFFEFRGEERLEAFKFGSPAANVCWPEEYRANGKRLWDDSLLFRRKTPVSEQIWLNGLWAVQSVAGDSDSLNPDGWFYAPLPAGLGWCNPVFSLRKGSDRLVASTYSKITQNGKRHFYWYERTFRAEKHWKGREVLLNIAYLNGEALVYVNGKAAGMVSLVSPEVDISPFLKYGEENRLDFRLFTDRMKPQTTLRNGVGGITGDISLIVSRYPKRIRDLWVRKADGVSGAFRIEAEVGGDGVLKLELADPEGKIIYTQTKNAAPLAVFEDVCADFRPWSMESPALCTARLLRYGDDGKLQEICERKFGFRTWENRNGRFYLNGKPVRLRMGMPGGDAGVYAPQRLQHLRRLGFNAVYLHSMDYGWNDPLFEACDREGFAVLAPVNPAASDAETVAEIKRLRNHPSVYGYITDPYGQFSQNGFLHNPFMTSDSYMPDSAMARATEEFMERRDHFFRSIDPSRGYISHATGNWRGFMRSGHHYPTNALNLLDRMMYFQPWSKRADRKHPLCLIEAGVINLYGMDTGHPEHKMPVMEDRRPVMREVIREAASRYIGPRAFENWLEWAALLMRIETLGYRLNGVDAFTPWTNELAAEIQNAEKALDVKDNRILSWRYFTEPYLSTIDNSWMRMSSWFYRLRATTGNPWPAEYGQPVKTEKPSIFASIYENLMQPVCLAITAGGGEIFTRDHNYYPGEKLAKQLTVCNDSSEEFILDAEVVLKAADRVFDRRKITGKVPRGEIRHSPFEFAVPETAERLECELVMNAAGRKEVFPVTVFPRLNRAALNSAAGNQKIAVLSADTPSLTEKFGLKAVRLETPESIPVDTDLLVIERNMLKRNFNWDALEKWIVKGGKVLIFEQTDSSLFSHRLTEQRLEHAFISASEDALAEGLRDADLSFWRGRAESVPAERRPSKAFRNGMSVRLSTPHLTNRNIVAGYALPNFTYGSFRPVITGGYDRSHIVAAKARSGKGKVWFCQADVTSRIGVEPAAELLTFNLFRDALVPVEEQIAGVRYSGDAAGRAFLERLGIRIVSDSPVGVAGKGGNPQQLETCRTIVRLPGSSLLPDGVKLEKRYLTKREAPYYWQNRTDLQFIYFKGLNPGADDPSKAGELFAGLAPNDFFLFENPKTEVFDFAPRAGEHRSPEGSAGCVKQNGKTYVLCGMSPDDVHEGEEKERLYRVWSVLFHNLNVASVYPVSFRVPETDLTHVKWSLVLDPDSKGETCGLAEKTPADMKVYPIRTGKIWEEQGVTDRNPNISSVPDSAYDGAAWYVAEFELSEFPRKQFFLHAGGIFDIPVSNRTEHQTTLWLNGKKMPEACGVWNAYLGGVGARLWKLPEGALKRGQNRIAIQIYNATGPGGIFRNPVRLETEGLNRDLIFPYEFRRSKYTNDFFWCW